MPKRCAGPCSLLSFFRLCRRLLIREQCHPFEPLIREIFIGRCAGAERGSRPWIRARDGFPPSIRQAGAGLGYAGANELRLLLELQLVLRLRLLGVLGLRQVVGLR